MFYTDYPKIPTLQSDAFNSATEGDDISLVCSTQSDDVIKYQLWLGSNMLLEALSNNNIETYIVSDVNIDDHEGRYTCKVQSRNGLWSSDSNILQFVCT